MTTKDTFDYGQIPYETWLEFGAVVGADERHIKFAAAKFRKCTNTQAAREAGFGTGNDQSTRSEGYRVARSNKINQLLAMASAEAGGGYDGTLTKQESRSLLTAMARGSDPNIKIKAIELLNKMEREEAAANAAKEGTADLVQEMAALICLVPSLGAFLAMEAWFTASARHFGKGSIGSFPFLREVGPLIARDHPQHWARWCSATVAGRKWRIDELNALTTGPVLEGDELVAAVRAKTPARQSMMGAADVD